MIRRSFLMLRRSSSWPLCNTCNLSLCSCCSIRGYTSSAKHSVMSHDQPQIILYLLRRDVRLSDNPAFHCAAQQLKRTKPAKNLANGERRSRDDSLTSEHGVAPFTHLLPVFVFPAHQIESSGFLSSPSDQSPYPEARSQVAKVWRTGPHRAKFIGEGVWDLKQRLEGLNCDSGLEIRVGTVNDVAKDILESYSQLSEEDGSKPRISGIWMTHDDGTEERDEEKDVGKTAAKYDIPFKVWEDEKFYIDECVVPAFVTITLSMLIMLTRSVGIFHTLIYLNSQTFTRPIVNRWNRSGIARGTLYLHRLNFLHYHRTFHHKKLPSRFHPPNMVCSKPYFPHWRKILPAN